MEADWRSLISLVIALVTKSGYSHGMICVKDVWYDASESRGNFNVTDRSLYDDRNCIVWDIKDHKLVENFVQQSIGKKYDYKGVIGWIWNKNNDKRRFYCFEACWQALKLVGMVHIRYNVCAKDIINTFDRHNIKPTHIGKGLG